MVLKWDTIVDRLKRYYLEAGRDYPWRKRRDVYGLYVAEILLQRTPADRCVGAYLELVGRYPTPEALCHAERTHLWSVFSKLGLVKRADWLRRGCAVLSNLDARPVTEAELRTLPGVGEYSARAIVLATRGEGTLPVDTNVERVLTRIGVPRSSWGKLVICREAFYGLLDLAASHCRPENPTCGSCPMSDLCRWYLRR